jgi:hypothetical protein
MVSDPHGPVESAFDQLQAADGEQQVDEATQMRVGGQGVSVEEADDV